MAKQVVPTSEFRYSKWIVAPTLKEGTHTSIQAAIDDASAGDTIFIRDGTYTENITLKAGVDLSAWIGPSVDDSGNAIIVGKVTHNTAGDVVCGGITFVTNGDYAISVSGTVASVLRLSNCFVKCTNFTGIQFSSSSASAAFTMQYCNADITSAGIAIFNFSSPATSGISYSQLRNTAQSTTANTISAGFLFINWSQISSQIITSGTAGIGSSRSSYSNINNATPFTLNGTASSQSSSYDSFFSGTAPCISIGAGVTFNLIDAYLGSSNANAVVGTGTLNYVNPSFLFTSKTMSTTTKSCLNSGTYTPVLTFGGGSTGITYVLQNGIWTRNNNLITFHARVSLSSKGTSTGTALITLPPFPFDVSVSTQFLTAVSLNITFSSYLAGAIAASAPTQFQINNQLSPAGSTALTDTAFANNSIITVDGSYFTSS